MKFFFLSNILIPFWIVCGDCSKIFDKLDHQNRFRNLVTAVNEMLTSRNGNEISETGYKTIDLLKVLNYNFTILRIHFMFIHDFMFSVFQRYLDSQF